MQQLHGDIDDIGYGRQFASFYDEIMPKHGTAEAAVELLATLASEGGSALELGAGTGRVAIPLAKRIRSVVGVDSSPEMLEVLARDVASAGVDVESVHGDMRSYEDARRFSIVYAVCGTLSLVLEAEQQRAAIRNAAGLVAPGGHLVIETHNPAGIINMAEGRRHFTFFMPYGRPDAGLMSSWFIDYDSSIWRASHIWLNDGSFRIGSEVIRLTRPAEIDDYAADAGLLPLHCYANWEGAPYSDDHTMFVAIYQKPQDAM